jgi:hypothetical protein
MSHRVKDVVDAETTGGSRVLLRVPGVVGHLRGVTEINIVTQL